MIRITRWGLAGVLLAGMLVGCQSAPRDPYGLDSSIGIAEAESLSEGLADLQSDVDGESNREALSRLAEKANRLRDRLRRLKVYIVTLEAILDDGSK